MKPEPRIPISCNLPRSLYDAVSDLKKELGLSFAQWLSTDPRVVAWRRENGKPDPVFSPTGRPRTKKRGRIEEILEMHS